MSDAVSPAVELAIDKKLSEYVAKVECAGIRANCKELSSIKLENLEAKVAVVVKVLWIVVGVILTAAVSCILFFNKFAQDIISGVLK